MTNVDMVQRQLIEVDRYLSEEATCIAQQEMLIERREGRGQGTKDLVQSLHVMRETLARIYSQRELVLANIANRAARAPLRLKA